MGDTVSVFNANNFKFIQDFGRYSLTPGCVTASKEFIYVLSTINGLYQYKSSDFTFVRKVESSFFQLFTNYIGIAVSEDNQVFIMDDCGSIKLYDRTLILKEKIKLDLKKFRELNHVYSMVMKGNNICILLTNKILLFVPFGDWKNIGFYLKKEEGLIPKVEDPSAFCIDPAGNVIVADSANKSIKFLSPEGELIHTIGKDTVGSGSIRECSDIASYKDSIIVACRDGNGFHIKIY